MNALNANANNNNGNNTGNTTTTTGLSSQDAAIMNEIATGNINMSSLKLNANYSGKKTIISKEETDAVSRLYKQFSDVSDLTNQIQSILTSNAINKAITDCQEIISNEFNKNMYKLITTRKKQLLLEIDTIKNNKQKLLETQLNELKSYLINELTPTKHNYNRILSELSKIKYSQLSIKQRKEIQQQRAKIVNKVKELLSAQRMCLITTPKITFGIEMAKVDLGKNVLNCLAIDPCHISTMANSKSPHVWISDVTDREIEIEWTFGDEQMHGKNNINSNSIVAFEIQYIPLYDYSSKDKENINEIWKEMEELAANDYNLKNKQNKKRSSRKQRAFIESVYYPNVILLKQMLKQQNIKYKYKDKNHKSNNKNKNKNKNRSKDKKQKRKTIAKIKNNKKDLGLKYYYTIKNCQYNLVYSIRVRPLAFNGNDSNNTNDEQLIQNKWSHPCIVKTMPLSANMFVDNTDRFRENSGNFSNIGQSLETGSKLFNYVDPNNLQGGGGSWQIPGKQNLNVKNKLYDKRYKMYSKVLANNHNNNINSSNDNENKEQEMKNTYIEDCNKKFDKVMGRKENTFECWCEENDGNNGNGSWGGYLSAVLLTCIIDMTDENIVNLSKYDRNYRYLKKRERKFYNNKMREDIKENNMSRFSIEFKNIRVGQGWYLCFFDVKRSGIEIQFSNIFEILNKNSKIFKLKGNIRLMLIPELIELIHKINHKAIPQSNKMSLVFGIEVK